MQVTLSLHRADDSPNAPDLPGSRFTWPRGSWAPISQRAASGVPAGDVFFRARARISINCGAVLHPGATRSQARAAHFAGAPFHRPVLSWRRGLCAGTMLASVYTARRAVFGCATGSPLCGRSTERTFIVSFICFSSERMAAGHWPPIVPGDRRTRKIRSLTSSAYCRNPALFATTFNWLISSVLQLI